MKKNITDRKDKRRRILLASIAIAISLIMILPAVVPFLVNLFN